LTERSERTCPNPI